MTNAATLAEQPAGHSARGVAVFLACAVASFADGYDVQALGLAIPRMATEFALPATAFALATSSSLIGMALGALLLASLADRIGAGRALSAILVLIAGATVGPLFVVSPIMLAGWRFFSGLGLGAAVPVAIALTSFCAPVKWRAAVVTLMVSFTGVGALAAGLLAPVLASHGGWRGIFAFGAVMPLLGAVLVASIGGIGPIPRSVRSGDESGTVRTLFQPSLRRLTFLVWALFWLNLMVNYSLISWLPTLLVKAGWDMAVASRASGLIAIGGIFGSIGISAVADRSGSTRAVVAAYCVAATALMLFAILPPYHLLWMILLLFVGLSAFGAQIALGALTALGYPMHVRATAAGWASGFGRTGAFLGPLILAMMMSAGAQPPTILGIMLVPMILCAIIVNRLPNAGTVATTRIIGSGT